MAGINLIVAVAEGGRKCKLVAGTGFTNPLYHFYGPKKILFHYYANVHERQRFGRAGAADAAVNGLRGCRHRAHNQEKDKQQNSSHGWA